MPNQIAGHWVHVSDEVPQLDTEEDDGCSVYAPFWYKGGLIDAAITIDSTHYEKGSWFAKDGEIYDEKPSYWLKIIPPNTLVKKCVCDMQDWRNSGFNEAPPICDHYEHDPNCDPDTDWCHWCQHTLECHGI